MAEQKKFIYADREEQIKKVNQLALITYGMFAVGVVLIILVAFIRGYRTAGYTAAFTFIAAGFVVLLLACRSKKMVEKVKWISLVVLCMIGFLATYAFASYYLRFGVVTPMVVYILYYDKRFMQISVIAMSVIQVLTTVTKFIFGSDGVDLLDIACATTVVIFFLILLRIVQKSANLFQNDMMGSIKEEKDQQETMMNDVIYVAGEVRKGTRSAMSIMNELNESTGVVTGAVKDISDSTQSTAENIQNQTVMTQNIQDAIERTLQRSEAMVGIADKSKELNDASLDIMKSIKEQSKVISTTNANVAERMESLQERAHDVKGIADTIFAISAQTNLLALNASIESARAGEAGRGFAVVADEIRQLAEKTRVETENIAAILGELSQNAEEAVGAVAQSVGAAEQQDEFINRAAESFEEMNTNVGELTQNIEEIDKMLTDLSEANNQIVDSITQLSATTQEVTASSAQAEGISNRNLENADNTKDLLEQVLTVSQQLDKYVGSGEGGDAPEGEDAPEEPSDEN